MCLAVGIGATVYHPINSSDGNTCLSFSKRRALLQIKGTCNVHWSLLCVKNAWSINWPSEETASSNVLTISTSRPFCVPRSAPKTVIADRQRLEIRKPTGYLTKRVVRVSAQFHPRQMFGYVQDGQRVPSEI